MCLSVFYFYFWLATLINFRVRRIFYNDNKFDFYLIFKFWKKKKRQYWTYKNVNDSKVDSSDALISSSN